MTHPFGLAQDIHSFARPEEARVTHVSLDLRADFDARCLAGTATLTIAHAPNATAILLDTRDLEIASVASAEGTPLPFELAPPDPILGTGLRVRLPASGPIVITYRTSPAAGALQWLVAEQTAGKRHPYLFSQGQAILTRTWIPTQDSPGVRQTYDARLIVPRSLRAVMSAESLTPNGTPVSDLEHAFTFRMTEAIPPYLMAIAVGDLSFRALGARSGVYAEPSMIDAVAYEFANMEAMVDTAEALLGAYRWGRYDVLVLPPSFPFGGMENPRVTFATPTVIAGDRSLVSLVAHELAHSWSGNLVTNATWSDFWLNEGVTTYVEGRIMEALYGPAKARMLEVLAWHELHEEIERLGGPASRDTILHVDLSNRDPDDGMTRIAYEKGASLFRLIEGAVGRPAFDRYLKSYLDRYAFQSIPTSTFLADLREHLIRGDEALENRLRLDEWIYQPGLPTNAVEPRSPDLEVIRLAAKAYADGGHPAADLSADAWGTQEWLYFLGELPVTLTAARMGELDGRFNLSAQRNSEVLCAWLRLAIRHRYQAALPALERFLSSQGRRKFLRPLYEELHAQPWGQADARRIYARARPLYHAVVTATLDPLLLSAS